MNNLDNRHPGSAVKSRYAAAAKVPEAALCCPVEYNHDLLKVIPQEVIEKDYGCGDPSRYLRPGETVLDLGSGAGKICFIAAQIVGASGHVIGVDMTDEMLEVARRNAPIVAQRLGYANVEFRRGVTALVVGSSLRLDVSSRLMNTTLPTPVRSATRLLRHLITVLPLCSALLGRAAESAPNAPSKEVKTFTVKGNKILDIEGRPFIIKGIASPYGPFCGGMKEWDSINTVERDFDLIRGLGCNLVRILVTRKAAGADADRARLIAVVAQARKRGFVVEISNAYTSFDDNLTKPIGGQPGWLAWLASQWKDDPYVWLQPMNEPNGSPPGDPSKIGDWTYWQREQNQYIATIRKAGNTAPLVINTPHWSWDFSGIDRFPLDDPQHKIIYAPHRYANENTRFTDEEKTRCDTKWGQLAARYPMVVDEVGGQNPPNEMHIEWNRGFLSYCADWVNDRQGCGVVAFNWYWCDDNSMTGDWRRNLNNGELNEWGQIFRDNYLKRVQSTK